LTVFAAACAQASDTNVSAAELDGAPEDAMARLRSR